MALISLENGRLRAKITQQGGAVHGLWWQDQGLNEVSLLRPTLENDAHVLQSSAYPLVPFGNRLGGNQFTFSQKTYVLSPNHTGEPHYIHGDGWLGQWDVKEQSSASATLIYCHAGGPYCYEAEQCFELGNDVFTVTLGVINKGTEPLPFGLGWHPFFPLTPQTELQFSALDYWTEGAGSLPDEMCSVQGDFDFRINRNIPQRWFNNGFSNWDGLALITWPESALSLQIKADPIFRHLFLYQPYEGWSDQSPFFCFEPMSHQGNAHHLANMGDLKLLKPGETLRGSVRLLPRKQS